MFRKDFELIQKPDSFIIHISADQRYRLYVNGHYIGNGPVLADVSNWQYDTYNLAPFLLSGKNAIAVEVWNYPETPWAQISLRTSLIVQGHGALEECVNTNPSWQFAPDRARTFLPYDYAFFPYLIGVGNGELFDARQYEDRWKFAGYQSKDYLPAVPLEKGQKKGQSSYAYYWSLIPRAIPYMEEKPQFFEGIRSDSLRVSKAFLKKNEKIRVPPNMKCQIWFDQGKITTAYPQMQVHKGSGSTIQLTYAESYFNEKGQKNPVATKEFNKIIGYYDRFYPAGSQPSEFSTLRFRTFRYIQIDIQTANDTLVIDSFSSIFTAYPFALKSSFRCSDTLLNQIFNIGWHTARLCAHENYFDCPYYEQQQYFGDLNTSNPITVLLSGDARLMKNAIYYGNSSRLNGDLTMCAYSGYENKIIPTFSLSWIDLVKTYLIYTGDTTFTKQMLPGVNEVLHWFEQKVNRQGMLGTIPYWNFIDCNASWPWNEGKGSLCMAPCAAEGNSAILTLQYIWGLQRAAELYQELGQKQLQIECLAKAEKLKKSTFAACWNYFKNLLVDCPAQPSYSPHTNLLGLLTGTIPSHVSKQVLQILMNDSALIQASAQFKVVLHQLLFKENRFDLWDKDLQMWKNMISLGFTTFSEFLNANARSYTHAWNAYPAYEMLTLVCGMNPIKAGMKDWVIEPQLGRLQWANGALFTPYGNIEIKITQPRKYHYVGTCSISSGISATLKVNQKTIHLKQGINYF